MITIFNRKELMTFFSARELHAAEDALRAAGIPFRTVFATPMGRLGGRGHGLFRDPDASHDYKIFVHRDDYDRARKAI